eukprot:1350231-Prymnesium_polylepis.1
MAMPTDRDRFSDPPIPKFLKSLSPLIPLKQPQTILSASHQPPTHRAPRSRHTYTTRSDPPRCGARPKLPRAQAARPPPRRTTDRPTRPHPTASVLPPCSPRRLARAL